LKFVQLFTAALGPQSVSKLQYEACCRCILTARKLLLAYCLSPATFLQQVHALVAAENVRLQLPCQPELSLLSCPSCILPVSKAGWGNLPCSVMGPIAPLMLSTSPLYGPEMYTKVGL
jgi:hypothetical protein